MIQGSASRAGRQLEVLWTSGTLTGLSDAQLVGRFAGIRDATAELAFRELMNRHGPMVLGVCRQILRRPHDADDAFQATFLVLVRKGGSIRVGESLAPWLYAVAYRTLAKGVQRTMLFSKLGSAAVVVVLVGGMVTGAAVWGFQTAQTTTRLTQAGKPNPPPQVAQPKPTSPKPTSGAQAAATTEARNVPSPPGRKKNSVNIDFHRRFPGLRRSSMVLVESADRNAWEALSLVKDHPDGGSTDKVHPGWMRFELSPGTTATPVFGGNDLAALAIKGKTIDQIAVFNPEFGVWFKQRLLRPVEGEINPFTFGDFVLYQAGNDFYALTTHRPGFQILLLEGAEPATVSVGTTDIEVMQGNRLYVCSPKTGQWSTGVEVHVPPPGASPKQEEPPGVQ